MTADWSASFITPKHSTGEPGEPASYLRREFEVPELPVKATLHSTAVGLIEAHVNGNVVGDEVLTPGWTSYRHRLVVSSHDVTSLITPGVNALGAIMGEGWALGRLGWEEKRNHYSERPAAWLQLDVEYADGRTERITTDGSFRAGTGAVLANSIYDGETYDARLEPFGWDKPGFDDSQWAAVEIFDWPLEALVEPTAPPIRRIEELAPVEILTTASGRTVVDFGQNISGWVRLDVQGPAGTTVTLKHSEVMIAGEADFETIRTAAATT
ncbi:family 78 glycoside hydrolase catalytic domain, partial [Paenarthrobacter sp. RAF9]